MDWLIGVRMVWKRAASAAVVEPDGFVTATLKFSQKTRILSLEGSAEALFN